MIFELVLDTWLKMQRLSVARSNASDLWHRTFNAFRDFQRNAPNAATRSTLPVNYRRRRDEFWKERFPDVGLKLLHAERQAGALSGSMASTIALHAGRPFFRTSEGCLTRLVQLRLLTWTKAVDAVFDFNEGAKVGQVAHATLDRHTPRGIFSCSESHGLAARLAHARAKIAALGRIER